MLENQFSEAKIFKENMAVSEKVRRDIRKGRRDSGKIGMDQRERRMGDF
jgi:hypothetical protein